MSTPIGAERGALPLAGRTAIVTGASSGLGARFARVLAVAGATVVAGARRTDRLTTLAREVPGLMPVTCDVSQADDRRRLVEAAVTQTGRVDVLVNNAGTSGPTRASNESADDFARVLGINLVAPFALSLLVAEVPAPERGKTIVNIGSVLGQVAGYPVGGAGYVASKAGIAGLTRELAAQWAGLGMRVNTLAPGWFASEMTQDLINGERSRQWVERNTLLRRPGEVHELDGALLFLSSDASSYVTGQTLVVDGGWTTT